MKLKLGFLATPPLTLKNGVATKTDYLSRGTGQVTEVCKRDEHLASGHKTDEAASRKTHTPDTKYWLSDSVTGSSRPYIADTSKNGCHNERPERLGSEDNCRCLGTWADGRADGGSASRGRSVSTSSSDSSSTTCTNSSDFEGSNSSSGTSSNTVTSENSAGSAPRIPNISPFTNKNTAKMSSCTTEKISSQGDTLSTLNSETTFQSMKKRRNCAGAGLPGLMASSVARPSLLLARPLKISSVNKFNILKRKPKGITLRNKTLDRKSLSIKTSSLNVRTNTTDGTSLNAKTTSLSFKTNSLNLKTNSLSSTSSCDSKTSSSSANSTKSLRSLFLRGNVFSSSFTFGNSSSSSKKNSDSRTFPPNNNVINTNIVIIGDRGVGKSAIAVRFLTRRYIGEYNSDTEMMYQHETMVDHEAARLQLLDAATAQTPHQILRHLAWADAFIVVYDVTSRTSFVHARQLLHILHTNIPAVSYTHAAGDNDANTANALDINPQSTHDIQLRSGSNECPVSAHIPYVLQSHDTSAPDSHGTHTVNSPNTQSSYKQSTVSRCDLNTHILSSHDIHIKDGQDSCVQGDNNTPVWSNHDVFKSNAKRFHQSNHTHLNYSHLPCQSSTASHTGSSCRYCSARSSSMVINAEESSRDIHQQYCRALNYIPHTGTSSQSVSHSSHHPNNYSLSIKNRQVDSHCHNSNMHGLHIYRHQYQGNPRYASKQNKMTDKHINHNYINHQHNSREQFPTTYDCVICHDPIGSQNFINPAGLNLLHSRVLDADTPSDHSDTGIKNLKKQVHLSKTSFLKQSECMNRSVTYVNEFPVQSCHRDPRSNHGQQRIHCLHHTQQRRHTHRQNHLRHDIPSYSYQRGYNSNHNHSASNSFDSSHQRDCNQDHSHPRSHSPDYSHVRGQDKDQSHLQHCTNNNHKSHGADRNHLKSYSSDHSPPKDHNPDHNHSRGYNPKHSRVKDHNLDHSYARDSNPGHSDQRDDSRDHSDARDSSPEPSFQREDSPDNYYSKDDSPDHKHLRGHTTLLLGNKRDLEHFRCVFTDEGEALSLEFSCQFYEVSAADSMLGVHLAFHSLLKEARALQFIRRLPQPSPKVSKSVLLSSAVSKVIGNFFTRTGAVPNKGSQITFDKLAQKC